MNTQDDLCQYYENFIQEIEDCDEIQHETYYSSSVRAIAIEWWAEVGYITIIQKCPSTTFNGNVIAQRFTYTFELTELGKAIWALKKL